MRHGDRGQKDIGRRLGGGTAAELAGHAVSRVASELANLKIIFNFNNFGFVYSLSISTTHNESSKTNKQHLGASQGDSSSPVAKSGISQTYRSWVTKG